MVQLIDSVRRAENLARARFSYKHDNKDRDTWRSFAKDVVAGKAWQGDCDDLASTVCDLAHKNGVPLDRLWFACVSAYNTGKIDHMIALFKDEKGLLWVIGDTFGSCYLMSRMKHGPVKDGNKFYVCNLAKLLNWDYRTIASIQQA